MSKRPKAERSPKGLLTNRQIDFDQVPELRQRIADHISAWRQHAAAEAASAKKKPTSRGSDTEEAVLDRKVAADYVYKWVGAVEVFLERLERDFAEGRAPSPTAIYLLTEAALLLGTHGHQLTIVGNESAIASTLAKAQALKESQAARSECSDRIHQNWQAQAVDIWQRHPGWSKSNVAEEIAKNDSTANANTIRRRIKKVVTSVRR